MKIFKYSVKFWDFCGVYLSASSTASDSIRSLITIALFTISQIYFFWLSLKKFIDEKDTVALTELFYTILQISGVATALIPYLSTALVKRDIGDLVELLERVVNKSKVRLVPVLRVDYQFLVCRNEASQPILI